MRACGVLRVERSSYHYRGSRVDQANFKNRVWEIAETRVRYGYRRIHVLLRRDGWDVNGKRVYRLYKELGQRQVPRGLPEPALVHEPRRRGAKMRALEQRLQRNSTT